MTEQRRGSRAQAAPRRRSGKAPSAGLPSTEPGSAGQRLAELEARLARLETSTSLRDRGRDVMGRVVPPEAGRHFRNAGREQLLGIRSIVDFWIRRIELAEERAEEGPARRESIHVD
jgi:hypothetical protein